MKTFRARFYLSSPIVLDSYGLLFDSLVLRMAIGDCYPERNDAIDLSLVDELFLRHIDGWILASQIELPRGASGRGFWCKRMSHRIHDYVPDAKGIDPSRGKYKMYKEGIETISVPYADFYFCPKSDNAFDVISKLCLEVPGLGKHVASGYGFVSHVKVDEVDESVWNIVRRPIPKRMFNGEASLMQYRTFEPPYWMSHRAELCVVDGVV